MIELYPTCDSKDTVPPVISLIGDNPILVYFNQPYTDPGATAFDNIDGDITDKIVTSGGVVDTSKFGTYTITYNVSDSSGNMASPVTRTVEVTLGDESTYDLLSPN